MKNIFHFAVFLVLMSFSFQNLIGQDSKPWYQDGPWIRPTPNPKAKILPLIKVVGNKFVNSKGDTILFRGLAISCLLYTSRCV